MMLDTITQTGLTLPRRYPEKWVVDCKAVGAGANLCCDKDSAVCRLGFESRPD